MRNRWMKHFLLGWDSALDWQFWWEVETMANNHWLITDADKILSAGRRGWGLRCKTPTAKQNHVQITSSSPPGWHNVKVQWIFPTAILSISGGHQKSTQNVTTQRRLNFCSFVGGSLQFTNHLHFYCLTWSSTELHQDGKIWLSLLFRWVSWCLENVVSYPGS